MRSVLSQLFPLSTLGTLHSCGVVPDVCLAHTKTAFNFFELSEITKSKTNLLKNVESLFCSALLMPQRVYSLDWLPSSVAAHVGVLLCRRYSCFNDES